MAPVEQIEEQIRHLSREDRVALRRWFIEFEAEEWNAAIEEDVAAGKLDAIADRAVRAHHEGQTRPL